MVEIIRNDEKTGIRNRMRMYRPPLHLSLYIRYYWMLEVREAKPTVKILEAYGSRYPRLVFQHLRRGNPIKRDGNPLPCSSVCGMATKCNLFSIYGDYAHTAVSFQPGGLKRFFGIDAWELNNDVGSTSEFSVDSLNKKLYDAQSNQDKTNVLNHFFTERLKEYSKYRSALPPFILNQAFDLSDQMVYELTKKLKISERHLQRIFKATIGVSPYTYRKILRFEAALQKLNTENFSTLSEVTFDLGYADQSHFIREFKEFSDLTPKQFLQNNYLEDEGAAYLKPQKQELTV